MKSKTTKENKQRKSGKKSKSTAPSKVSYYRKPESLTMDQWQAALRKQFAEIQYFSIKNIGNGAVFSDYQVTNATTKGVYKVALRGAEPGWNYCSCPDFKTNLLGTCKHIEFILFNINKAPRKKKILKAGYNPHYTSIYLYYGAKREVKIRIGYEEEARFLKLAKEYFDEHFILKRDKIYVIENFLTEAHNIHSDFRIYPDAMEFILNQRAKENRKLQVDKAFNHPEKFLKSIINAELFPYQKDGIRFLIEKGRGLLADDMGLGKTIQAIGAAEGMKNLFGISSVLIVCPTSLKYQWKSEINKFTKSSITVIEGNILKRKELYTDGNFYKICSYNVVSRDIDYINQAGFDLVILDEAQRIKNWKTLTAASVKKINTPYCFVLTGTPIENKLEELYSVVQMIDPLYLGALFRFLERHQIKEDETGKIVGYKDLDKIAILLKEMLLRRNKKDVLKQLPERMDKNLFVPMTGPQREIHADAYDQVSRLVNKWVKVGFLNEKDRNRLMISLNIMRMSCDSTFIIDQKTRFDTKVDELLQIIEEAFENGIEKIVVFSQWERMTRIIGWELEKQGIEFASLHGGVPSKDREDLFTRFREDDRCRIFLSTDAGGVGLNLQSASLLVNMDLPWNPGVLEQRIGRIHRMGQKRKVQIINLVSAGTIEEEMLSKLKFKTSMASGILDHGDSMVFLGESQFEKLMKEVHDLTGNIEVPNQMDQTDMDETKEKATGSQELFDQNGTTKDTQAPIEDIAPIQKTQQEPLQEPNEKGHEEEPLDEVSQLMQAGAGFLGGLLETLSDKSKTNRLINTIVQKDEKSGESYLKIPVQSKEIVENGIKLLGQLLGGIGKK